MRPWAQRPARALRFSRKAWKLPRQSFPGSRAMWLTRLALRDPVLILMMSLMVMVLGWVSLRGLSVPNIPVRPDLLSAFGQSP